MEQRPDTAPTQTPQAPAPAQDEARTAYPAHVGQAVGALAAGLFPGFGIAVCLWWAYGSRAPAQKRLLAKAMLWLHGAGLCAALVGLCLWVLRLAGF